MLSRPGSTKTARPGEIVAKQILRCLNLSDLDVFGLPALWSFHHVKLDRLTFLERPESVALNGRVMDEDVFAVGAADKSEALGIVEPFYSSLFHDYPFAA